MTVVREQFNLRVYGDDVALWRKAADLHGVGLSSWLRWVANMAARQQLATEASMEARGVKPRARTKKAASRR